MTTGRLSLLLPPLMLAAASAQDMPVPQPLPIPNFYDFCSRPELIACPADLFTALMKGDVVRMRRHAWNVFAGMTQPGTNDGLPIFMTWKTRADLFPDSDPKRQALARATLEIPVQFHDTCVKVPGPSRSKNFYNQQFFDFVVTRQHYNTADKLCGLMNDLMNPPAKIPKEVEDWHIDAFPPDAIAVKTIWRRLEPGQVTLVPVWDPAAESAQPLGNDPDFGAYPAGRWSRFVAVDLRQGATQAGQMVELPDDYGTLRSARVVPLSSFFSVKLSQLGVGGTLFIPALSGTRVKPDDETDAVLVGLHFTTKEIPNWVWATFWWHDLPDFGPYAAARPSLVRGLWRNYLMNVSYSMTEPREWDGKPHIAFNPYLEGPLQGGITSNCMTCHRRAAWPPVPGSFCDTSRLETPVSDATAFGGRLKLDFIWTLTATAKPSESGGCPVIQRK